MLQLYYYGIGTLSLASGIVLTSTVYNCRCVMVGLASSPLGLETDALLWQSVGDHSRKFRDLFYCFIVYFLFFADSCGDSCGGAKFSTELHTKFSPLL